MQGLSYKEIAEIMQCPVGTVMSRLFRGRKLLAQALREFALAEGYVKSSEPIDLEKYRAAKASRREPRMSVCDSIDTLAMSYLDDELAAQERHELETHLTECAHCRSEVEAARSDQCLRRGALVAPRATDTMRMRLLRPLDEIDRETARAERRRLSSWLLPGSAIAAAAAAIAMFVGVGVSPQRSPSQSDAPSVAKAQAADQLATVRGRRREHQPLVRQHLASMDVPKAAQGGSKLLGAPRPVNSHETLLAYDITVDGQRATLKRLVVDDLHDGEMTDGEEMQAGDRVVHVVKLQGHTIVTYVDAQHHGYMFRADELPAAALVALVGRTSLVGPQ